MIGIFFVPNISKAEGNGAPSLSLNLNRPFISLISVHLIASSCHQRVSVLQGTRQTHNPFCVLSAKASAAFLTPFADLTSIRRIHPATITAPVLFQSVLCFCVIHIALSICIGSANVQLKVELFIQLVKDILRSCPLNAIG